MYELEIYRGVVCHDNEGRCKIWRGIDVSFQNWNEEFDEFRLENLKVSNFALYWAPFDQKYVLAEKVQRSYVSSHWRVMQNLNKNWFVVWKWQKFGKFLPEHLKISKLGLSWDPYIRSRKCMSLKFTEEFCIMTMKNNAKFQ